MSQTKIAGARKRGRPTLPADDVKRHPLGLRTTRRLKDQLTQASADSGRSIAQEIEFRLERSFDKDDGLGDPRTAALLRTLAGTVKIAPGEPHWLDDFTYFAIVTQGWTWLINELRPQIPDDVERKIRAGRDALEMLRDPDMPREFHERLWSTVEACALDTSVPGSDRQHLFDALGARDLAATVMAGKATKK